MRAIAALGVVFYHLPGPLHVLAPRGYLAVDLFFLMSGFVIAAAYEARLLAGMGTGAFLLVRLKRLWPLYGLGVVLGVLVFSLIRFARPDAPFVFPHMPLAAAIAASLAFLPQLAAYGGPAFPFNSASWSLSVELFGNLAYASLARTLRTPLLAAFAAVGLCGLAVVAFKTGNLDVGVSSAGLAGGYVRFLFSFALGVLLYRLHAAGRLPALRAPAWLTLGATGLAFTGFAGGGPIWDLVVVAGLFPAVVIASREPIGARRLAGAFAWACAVSYPLYILHPPLIAAITVLVPATALPAASSLLLAGLVAAAALANRYFDHPIQSLLRQPRKLAPA